MTDGYLSNNQEKKYLSLVLTKEDFEKILNHSRVLGLNVSNFIRLCVLKEVSSNEI
jgi:hypothetical protein